jgi:hypothetical protein
LRIGIGAAREERNLAQPARANDGQAGRPGGEGAAVDGNFRPGLKMVAFVGRETDAK